MGVDKIARLFKRVAFALRAKRHAADLAAELEAHRAHVQAHLEAEGLPRAEAAARSRQAMGNMTLAREDAREVWLGATLQRAWRDAVYGARALRREPTFALTALLALTLGIATTTTVFSIVDAELWKPLPFPDAHELVGVHATKPGGYDEISASEFLEWRAQSRLAKYVAANATSRRVLRLDRAESVTMRPITPDFLDVLGVIPAIGRGFTDEDAHGARTVILTDAGWTRLFERVPSALGRSVSIDEQAYTIVGITAGTRFEIMTEPDFFGVLDLTADPARERVARTLDIYGRLHDGVGIGEAQAELRSLAARTAGGPAGARSGRSLRLGDLQHDVSGYNWREMYFFFGAAALLLLLSCLNVTGLLLARALRRQREFAIRGALGGGLTALVRQLIVEGALLAVPASAAGIVASVWLLRILSVQIPPGHLERGGHIQLDLRATAFVLGLCGLTTIVLALTPLFFARRLNLNLTLGQGGRAIGPSRRHRSARSLLLVGQVTTTVVLLTAAALFAFSFFRVSHTPLGFDPANRVALRLSLSGPRYSTDAALAGFAARLLEQARAVGGVRNAAIGSSSPLDSRSGAAVQIVVPERPRPMQGQEPTALIRTVSPKYFRTLGIGLSAGREFTDADVAGAPRVAIVNELLARRMFPGETAIGRQLEVIPRLRTGWTSRPGSVVIVGVVSDVRNFSVNEVEFNNLYLAFDQAPAPAFELVAAAGVPPSEAIAGLRAAAARTDSALPVTTVATLNQRVQDAMRGDRFNLIVVAFFALGATLLAAIGIYGAMACSIEERTREFGIRIALGALPRALVVSALSSSLKIGLIGGSAGIAISFALARLLGNALYLVPGQHGGLLYGVKATDPAALASAAITLFTVVFLSGLLPARQAVRIDPLIALKTE